MTPVRSLILAAAIAGAPITADAAPGMDVKAETLLDTMLHGSTLVGASTPGADPSGTYAWRLFERADTLRPGAGGALKARALQLTGGPGSAPPPEGRDAYGWVMEDGQADTFLTCCTNAVLAKAEVPAFDIVAVPPELAVGADYGLIVLGDAPPEAWRLALYILSPAGQAVLARLGFETGAQTEEDRC